MKTINRVTLTIFLLFLGFMIIASFGSTHAFYLGAKQMVRVDLERDFLNSLEDEAKIIELFLDEQKEKMDIIAEKLIFEEFLLGQRLKSDIRPELEETLGEDFELMAIANTDGLVLVATDSVFEGVTLDRLPESITGQDMEEMGPFYGQVHYDEALKKNVLDLNSLVFDDASKEVIGFVTAHVAPEALNRTVVDTKRFGRTTRLKLVEEDGMLVNSSSKPDVFTMEKLDGNANSEECLEDLEELKKDDTLSPSMGEIFYMDNPEGKLIMSTHDFIEEVSWCILLEVEEEEAFRALDRQLLKSALIIGFVIVIVMAFFILLSDYIIRRAAPKIRDELKKEK